MHAGQITDTTTSDWPRRRFPVRFLQLRITARKLTHCRYSAIDMSTFEALKLAYLRSTGKDEPGVLATLAFGSVSGSVGATSVYPLNLVRTRLQASGSSGHPERYTGFLDVVQKTYARDGWRGFYRGLLPTLAKVRHRVSRAYQTCLLNGLGRWSLPCLYRMLCMNQASQSECPLKNFCTSIWRGLTTRTSQVGRVDALPMLSDI